MFADIHSVLSVQATECPRSCCRVLWGTAVLKSLWIVYTHLSESDLLSSFEKIGKNKNFDFYSLSRTPQKIAPADDTGELSAPDFLELPDDD